MPVKAAQVTVLWSGPGAKLIWAAAKPPGAAARTRAIRVRFMVDPSSESGRTLIGRALPFGQIAVRMPGPCPVATGDGSVQKLGRVDAGEV